MGCAKEAVRMGILDHAVIILVKTEIMARTVLFFVPQTVKRVDTQTDCALARRDGKEKIVLKNV